MKPTTMLFLVGLCACAEVDSTQLSFAASTLRDERGDTIEFSTGAPVHSHGGPLVDLAARGCPDVYKYAYLMDRGAQNPLAWRLNADGIDRSSLAYRVRDTGEHVILDWTKPATDTIELDRASVPALGTYEGLLYLDVRAREWSGDEVTLAACWHHHPLAAPLAIEPLAIADAIALTTLPGDSPISLVIAGSLPVATQRIVQYAAEPVVIDATIASGALSYAKTVVSGYVPVAAGPNGACGTVDCTTSAPAAATSSDSAGALAHATWQVSIADDAGKHSLPYTIPPHAGVLTLVVELASLGELSPAPGSEVGEHLLAGLTYTGQAPGAPITACTNVGSKCSLGGCLPVCWSSSVFQPIVALDRVRVELAPLALDLRVSPAATVPAMTPPHVPAANLTTPAITWDAGDDDLPGPF